MGSYPTQGSSGSSTGTGIQLALNTCLLLGAGSRSGSWQLWVETPGPSLLDPLRWPTSLVELAAWVPPRGVTPPGLDASGRQGEADLNPGPGRAGAPQCGCSLARGAGTSRCSGPRVPLPLGDIGLLNWGSPRSHFFQGPIATGSVSPDLCGRFHPSPIRPPSPSSLTRPTSSHFCPSTHGRTNHPSLCAPGYGHRDSIEHAQCQQWADPEPGPQAPPRAPLRARAPKPLLEQPRCHRLRGWGANLGFPGPEVVLG